MSRSTERVSSAPDRCFPRWPRVWNNGPGAVPRYGRYRRMALTTAAGSGTSSFSFRPLPLIQVVPAPEVCRLKREAAQFADAQAETVERRHNGGVARLGFGVRARGGQHPL